MAQVSLDDPQIDSGFEEMGGIVPEGMNGDSLFMASSSNLGPTEGALDTTFGHGRLSLLGSCAVSSKSGEEQARAAVGKPMATEQMEGGLGERGTWRSLAPFPRWTWIIIRLPSISETSRWSPS